MREATLAAFSDSDTDHDSAGRNTGQVETLPTLPHARRESQASVSTSREEMRSTQTPQQRRDARKRPLMDIVRENQLHYNRFITKKVPKLLRQLGVSSDESD
ncbi:uncharacterized protein LOC123526119 [Mercenaria mercenaria]|uniref:uncharacterized protein LOC123526119 n=1 Tax=Mercenaria mercenaria TaxID=6596 RepID=UPI00234E800C|nr:uncharacterized protein LOC123526119 [Mercenaria mercenaria]